MSGGAGGQTSKSKTKDLAPKEYKRERGFVVEELKNRIGGNVNQVTGPFVAPISQGESDALGQFQQNAYGSGGVGAAADEQLKATLGDPNANPFLRAMIDAAIRPITQNAQIQELRDRAQFTGTGQKIQGSSAFQENRNNAIRDTEAQVADVATRLAFAERQNQLQAVTLANSRLAEQREGIATLALPRLIEQFGIDAGNKELQRRFMVIEQALTQLASLTTPTLGTFSQMGGGNANVDLTGGGMAAPTSEG